MSQAQPYTVSPQLLARPEFRAACRLHDFAEVFKLMKKYDGMSQTRIGSSVLNMSQSRISKIMGGQQQVVAQDVIERLADGLRIPGSYLRLEEREWETGRAAADPPAVIQAAPSAVEQTAATGHLTLIADHQARTAPPLPPGSLALAEHQPYAPGYVERPVGLRPHIEDAFTQETVTIDFAGFSGETLAGALGEPLDKVRSGELTPSSIRIRILVPDTGRPWAFPCRIDDLADEPAFRQRATGIAERSLMAITEAVQELHDLGAVKDAAAEIRVHGMAPQFKLYLINDDDAFFGFYPVTEHNVRIRGSLHAMYDVMGKDSMLFHHHDDGDPASPANQFVSSARTWFDSVWDTVAQDYGRD